MAAPHITIIQGGRKPCFPGWEKLNYSIKTQLGLNDLSWILSQNGSRLNCPRIFRKLNTSPNAYTSTLTTLEIFIVIESSHVSSLFPKPMFLSKQNALSERTPYHPDLSGTPPGLGQARTSPGWKSMSWKSLSRKTTLLSYGCRRKCAHMRSLLCRPLVQNP